MEIGRQTDRLVQKAVTKKITLGSHHTHKRALEFFRLMKSHGIAVTAVQVPAVDIDLNIRTILDAVGIDKERRKVCIELKTSQHNKLDFAKSYYKQCRNQPILTNNLPNCLYWRHQLQAGFGVMTTDCTRGVVAVICEDGGILYDVTPTAMQRSMFRGACALSDEIHAPVLAYPTNADESLRSALSSKMKYTSVVSHNPTLIRGQFGDAVLLLIKKPQNYARSKAARGHRQLARRLAAKHHSACVIAWLDSGRWRFETAVKRPAV